MENEKIYTVAEVTKLLHTNPQTVYRLLQDGELQGYKQLRKWYVLHSNLIEFIKKGESKAHG